MGMKKNEILPLTKWEFMFQLGEKLDFARERVINDEGPFKQLWTNALEQLIEDLGVCKALNLTMCFCCTIKSNIKRVVIFYIVIDNYYCYVQIIWLDWI